MPKGKKKAAKPKKDEELDEKDPLLDEEAAEDVQEDAGGDDEGEDEKVDPAEEKAAAKAEEEAQTVKEMPSKVPYTDVVKETRDKLMNGPKTAFLIPLAPGEKPGAFETVQINGFRLQIRKGAMVQIPVACAEVLAGHYNVQLESGYGSEKRLDRASDVQKALS